MSSGPEIPLNALRAIEAVARLGALAPAAERLGVSVGAISQHIRRAEERCGQALFDRTNKGLVPTAQLRSVLAQLSQGFETLEAVSSQLMRDEGHVLNVTVGNVFASRWLVWRLNDFARLHPGIELRMITSGALFDLSRPDIDCGIRFGSGQWQGADALAIGDRSYFPVCAPTLAETLKSPADLANVPVIRDISTMLSWSDWLDAAGAGGLSCSGPTFNDPALAFDAAISGQGVLLAVGIMAEHALKHGHLVKPFAPEVTSAHGYWFVTAKGHQLPARVKKFRDWLINEMAHTQPH
ncbi:LysR substrate-binding domain-containing protein [Pelagibacterium lentulum]|uniref:Transcriptional regulator n=1 Tax=Pelagibacterium lentulum TaxID=2029865 RepID=A0A916R8R7_9HYPH|nr:LysR substrate-binding domain-containing protein [Pelagibacterium lentulum]GGA41804.1 transcriptional regulator [Pelagibacterium lentulum]